MKPAPRMKILLWNIEWRTPTSKSGQRIARIMQELQPDVICLTETLLSMIPAEGYLITALADHGYNTSPEKRKVVLWSRTPWTGVHGDDTPEMPGGRYVSGVTNGIRFTGVCIPWRDAHVSTGRKDRRPWEDHQAFLNGLAPLVHAQLRDAVPVCLLGDFNQRIPRQKQPLEVYESLMRVIGSGLTCVTATEHVPAFALIDHVAIDSRINARVLQILPKTTEDDIQLSDHEGVVAELTVSPKP